MLPGGGAGVRISSTGTSVERNTASTSSTTGALTVVGGVGIQGDINIEGDLDVNGQVDLSGVDVLPIGPGAKTFADTQTNPTVVAVTNHNDYAQQAILEHKIKLYLPQAD